MSVKALSHVWEHSKQKGAHLLVLLALADGANDDGFCWYSLTTIAKKARQSRNHTQRYLREMAESGELVLFERVSADEKHKLSNVYQIVMPNTKVALPVDLKGIIRQRQDIVLKHEDGDEIVSPDDGGSSNIVPGGGYNIVPGVDTKLDPDPLIDPSIGSQKLISSANDSAAASAENEPDCGSAGSAEHTDVQETPSEHAPSPPQPPESSAKAPPGAASAPVHKPTADERNAMFEAVCAQVFGITSREEIRLMPRHEASEAGAITSWLLRQNDRFKPNGAKGATPIEVGWISAPAQPDHVRRFTSHYQSRYPSMNLPTKIATFVRHWRAWASELQREQQRAVQAQQNAAKPALPEVRATPEELAAIKAELGFQARRLAESERA